MLGFPQKPRPPSQGLGFQNLHVLLASIVRGYTPFLSLRDSYEHDRIPTKSRQGVPLWVVLYSLRSPSPLPVVSAFGDDHSRKST